MNKKEILENAKEMTMTYVVDDDGRLLAEGRIITQNDFIELALHNVSSDDREVRLTSTDLRGLANKLHEWADLSDESCQITGEDF
jgi:hypothetical protein